VVRILSLVMKALSPALLIGQRVRWTYQ